MVQRKNQAEHDEMINTLVSHLKQSGHTNIKAAIEKQAQPDLLYWETTKKGHIPDVTSTSGKINYVFEVETSDSISDAHTEDQWNLFAINAKQYSKQFIVVVPKGSEEQAWQRARDLSITVHDVWKVG